MKKPVAVAAAMLVAAGLLAGCGSGPSVESFCAVTRESTDKMRSSFQEWQQVQASSGADDVKLMSSLMTSLQNAGELKVMFDRLEEVAPDEIHADIVNIQKLYTKAADLSSDVLGNPFGVASELGVEFVYALPSLQAWESYTQANCGDMFSG